MQNKYVSIIKNNDNFKIDYKIKGKLVKMDK